MKTILVILFSLIIFLSPERTQAAGPSGPPFKQCSPSGYTCNFLITLDRYGAYTISRDPNLYSYPPLNTDTGALVGFQNNSNSTVYSIGIETTTTHPNLSHVCYIPNTTYRDPKVKIINIPIYPSWELEDPLYGSIIPGPALGAPLEYGTSCDIVFVGGVPKGGAVISAWPQ